MLKNYLKIAVRKLLQNKLFGLLYIVCLGVGGSTAIMLYKYYNFESNYDQYIEKSNAIYRVNISTEYEGLEEKSARTSPAIGQYLKDNFESVNDFSRVVLFGESILSVDGKNTSEPNILLADSTFFSLFDYHLTLDSDLEKLNAPLTIAISKSTAQKLFGKTDVVGEVVKINSRNLDGTVPFTVKAVFNDVRKDSHLRPNVLISYNTLIHLIGKEINHNWEWKNLYTYVYLNDNVNTSDLSKTLNESLKNEYNIDANYSFQNISAIHNDLSYFSEFDIPVDGRVLKYLLILGLFLLLVTYVNVINLYASISSQRLKEVGVRKTAGASRYQLIIQFLTEAFIINLFGVLLAITVIQFSTPYFEYFFDIQGSLAIDSVSDYLPLIVAILIVGTLVSGFYPALIMSSWKTDKALKTISQNVVGGMKLRKNFLVIQFMASFFLIAGAFAVYKQMNYMMTYNIGVDIADKIIVKQPRIQAQGNNLIKDRIKTNFAQLNGVKAVTATDAIPGVEIYWRTNEYNTAKNQRSTINYTYLNVDTDYFNVFNIPFIAGKGFNAYNEDLDGKAIINESTLEALKIDSPEKALSTTVYRGDHLVEIVGVVKDFYQQGLKQKPTPTFYSPSSENMTYYVVSYQSSNPQKIIAQLKNKWENIFPESPFEYFFLDDRYNRQYQNDIRFERFFHVFSVIAIIISCIGLVGISIQSITQREKEMSIRKILGASILQLVLKLSGSYFKIAIMAYILSLPLAYYMLSNWLSNFADQIELGTWFYLLPLLSFGLLITIAIGGQIVKAVAKNPVDSLRSE